MQNIVMKNKIIGIGVKQVKKDLKIYGEDPNTLIFKKAIKQSNERIVVVDCPTLFAGETD